MIDVAAASPLADETSQTFLGQWTQLVSTTNWEKGRIVFEWRQALVDAGAPPTEFADDAWSRRVGNVSGQHVGRLRRVFERFGETREQYAGLYWSHFQAALDWDDAEMWLEGAVQNDWSISEMRRGRWEALGAPADLKPRDEDVIVGELDEDALPSQMEDDADEDSRSEQAPSSARHVSVGDDVDTINDALHSSSDDASMDEGEPRDELASVVTVAPFAELAELPADLADAFEAYKLAILRHKMSGWAEITSRDVLSSLDALKELVLAPTEA